jgi:integrase
LRVAYAQVALSAVNVVLEYMRGDRHVWLSPSKAVGVRCTVRTEAPIWLDRAEIEAVVARLCGPLTARVSAMIWLARELGLRWRECVLLDSVTALNEAQSVKAITVHRGTKGSQTRQVPVRTDRQLEALERAAAVQGTAANLIPPNWSFRTFAEHASRAFYAAGGSHFHDLRSSFACEMYEELAGVSAPAVGGVLPDQAVDESARLKVSKQLGHHRVTVVAAYVGARRVRHG